MNTAAARPTGYLPRHYRIEHQLSWRVRIIAPSLRKDPERGYILEILLRKREGIKRVRVVPDLGSVAIQFDPARVPKHSLFAILETGFPPTAW